MSRINPEFLLVFVLLALFCCGVPTPGQASAGEGVAVPIPADFCPVGQGWPGYNLDWIDPGTITGGGQTFFALLDSYQECSCPVGFKLTTADFFMTLPDEAPLPYTVTVSMGLAEAVPDPSGLLPWLPGPTVCETPVRDFTSFIPKDFVGFGMALECDCYEMGSPAFLFFTIHSEMDPPGGFFTAGGEAPDTGRFLTTVDGQWVDLVAEGILTSGDLVISGFASCCEPPVTSTTERWGSIKALYR